MGSVPPMYKPREGFEPSTCCLRGSRSTTEPPRHTDIRLADLKILYYNFLFTFILKELRPRVEEIKKFI